MEAEGAQFGPRSCQIREIREIRELRRCRHVAASAHAHARGASDTQAPSATRRALSPDLQPFGYRYYRYISPTPLCIAFG